jgi:hypothetical protein
LTTVIGPSSVTSVSQHRPVYLKPTPNCHKGMTYHAGMPVGWRLSSSTLRSLSTSTAWQRMFMPLALYAWKYGILILSPHGFLSAYTSRCIQVNCAHAERKEDITVVFDVLGGTGPARHWVLLKAIPSHCMIRCGSLSHSVGVDSR